MMLRICGGFKLVCVYFSFLFLGKGGITWYKDIKYALRIESIEVVSMNPMTLSYSLNVMISLFIVAWVFHFYFVVIKLSFHASFIKIFFSFSKRYAKVLGCLKHLISIGIFFNGKPYF